MTDKQDPITHAARLLREAAEELRQAHAYNRSEGWENETDAKAAYDEHMAAAQALEDWEAAVGAGGVQALSAAPAGFVPVAAFDRLHAHAESLAARLLAASPTPPAEQPVDPDGEAFRNAARLGLTLRFYGSCAQSSMPGTPSAYVVTQGGDRAEAMREAVEQAAAIIANGGEAPKAPLAPPAEKQAAPKAAPGEQFDSEGFRAWVLRNLPDETIIGSSAWWADHLTTWAQRFVKAAPQQEAQEPYSIDADPQGIRAVVADAITGALAFGAQGANPPPEGHWLTPFWEMAREEAMRTKPALLSRDTLYLLRRLLSNQHTLTSSEFRAELEKIVGEAYQQEAQEPWGACVSGRVFVGSLPEHARKLAEAENLPIQWLYTAPQPAPAPLSEREAFEAAWEKLHGKRPVLWSSLFAEHKMNTPAHRVGEYFGAAAQTAWELWQARAAIAAQRGKA